MGIKIECPSNDCRSKKRRFSITKKACPACGMLVKHFRHKRYWVEFIDNTGKKVRERVRGESLDAARYRWREISAAIGRRSPHSTRPNEKDLTLGELYDWYANLPKVRSLRSFHATTDHLRSIVERIGIQVKVSTLTQGAFENYQYGRLSQLSPCAPEATIKPSTVKVEMARLKALFNSAVAHGMIPANPVNGISRLKANKGRERHITPQELERLVQVAYEPYKSWIILGYYTGMRREEIVGLRWNEIDLVNLFIHLPAERTKTHEPRDVPIHHPRLVSLLEKISKGSSSFVFEKDGKKRWFINRTFRKFCSKAGIEDFHFHDLRYCCITNFTLSGMDWMTVKKIVGHHTNEMLLRYNVRTQDHLKEIVWFDQIDIPD